MQFKSLLLVAGLILTSAAANAFDPGHVERLRATGSCEKCDLSKAQLRGWTNLVGANLNGANLWAAFLADANLTGASLNAANLTRANLIGANLSGASLRVANLSGANLAGANLSRA
ncbi:MAG: pentapeptide repeat-containing protein, partial [Betaproteobacteria bacterium]